MPETLDELLRRTLGFERTPGTSAFKLPELQDNIYNLPQPPIPEVTGVMGLAQKAPMLDFNIPSGTLPPIQQKASAYEPPVSSYFNKDGTLNQELINKNNAIYEERQKEKESIEQNPYEIFLKHEISRLENTPYGQLTAENELAYNERRKLITEYQKQLGDIYTGRQTAQMTTQVGERKFEQEKELKELDYQREIDKAEIEIMGKIKEAQMKGQSGETLSGTIAVQLGDMDASLIQLDELQKKANEYSQTIGPVKGLSGLNPYSTDAQGMKQLIKTTKQIIGKGLEGGVLRKEDEAKYEAILPKQFDTMETFKRKQEQLRDMIILKQTGITNALDKAGYNVSNFLKQKTTQGDQQLSNISQQNNVQLIDVQTEAEAESLPIGSRFRLPDGRTGKVE